MSRVFSSLNSAHSHDENSSLVNQIVIFRNDDHLKIYSILLHALKIWITVNIEYPLKYSIRIKIEELLSRKKQTTFLLEK